MHKREQLWTGLAKLGALSLSILAGCASGPEKRARSLGEAAGNKVAYVDELARFDQVAIALGKLGLEKSQDGQVRQLAQELVDDHTQHLDWLRSWARGRLAEVEHVRLNPEQGAGGAGATDVGLEEMVKRLDSYQERSAEQQGEALEQYKKLEAKSGGEFDREFARAIERSQGDGQQLVQRGIDDYKEDAVFAALLRKTEPVVERHQTVAKTLEKSLK